MKTLTKKQIEYVVAAVDAATVENGLGRVDICTDAGNPFLFFAKIPKHFEDSVVAKTCNALFHALGLLPQGKVLAIDESSDYCSIVRNCDSEGNYAAFFNHPVVLDFKEDAPERQYIAHAWLYDDGEEWDDGDGETLEEMRKHYEDFLIPVPPPPKSGGEEVFMTLKYEFYDAIKAGKKTVEYREYTENWVKKLVAARPKRVKFQRGYGGPGRPAPEQMVFEVKGVWLYESETGMKGDPRNPPKGIVPDTLAVELGGRKN